MQHLPTGTAGFPEANNTVNIGTSLENLANAAIIDQDIMSKLSAANEELELNKSTLIGQLLELTAQLKVVTSTVKTDNTSRTVYFD